MDKGLLLIVLSAVVSFGRTYKAIVVKPLNNISLIDIKQQKHNSAKYTLSEKDKKIYILSIDQRKISKPRDTVMYNKKGYYLNVPLRLYNNSNDTLKYLNMSCSSFEIFQTDNKNISVTIHGCDNNFPVVFHVAPHKSSTIDIHVIFNITYVKIGAKFKMGMHLQKYIGHDHFDFDSDKVAKSKTNLIWSNSIKIPSK